MSSSPNPSFAPPGAAKPGGRQPYRVLLVDDSAVIRGLITRTLESDPEIAVVGSVANGSLAVGAVLRHQPEIVVLDIEMPVMDGLTALPKLIEADPALQVIMASTLTVRNADVSLRALTAGAKDYIGKPTSASALNGADAFKRELIEKVKTLGAARRKLKGPPQAEGARPARGPVAILPAAKRPPIALRRSVALAPMPEVIAIGSSTGGPQALFKLLGALSKDVKQPIVITQHMPATFTTILAEHIRRVCDRPCAEGQDGEALQRGHVYVAPGDFHLLIESGPSGPVLRRSKAPPENFCRPAVDPMVRSLAQVFGARVLAVILTGMGQDGLKGCQVLVEAGGTVIAQDEASSVVWGMPGAVAQAGVCSAVLPIDEIASAIQRIALRSAA
jgi:two-component system chemotaxis response regulator CheB